MDTLILAYHFGQPSIGNDICTEEAFCVSCRSFTCVCCHLIIKAECRVILYTMFWLGMFAHLLEYTKDAYIGKPKAWTLLVV